MKKIISMLILVLVIIGFAFAMGKVEQAQEIESDSIKIGISKLLSHPALDSIEKGITDYLSSTDIKYSVHVENANGDISTCASIAQVFKNEKIDIAVGIATPTAQAIQTLMSDTKQVYSSVTDPESAGLLGLDNVCGVSDMVPVRTHLELLKSFIKFDRLGMVYTSSEANGLTLKNTVEGVCKELGIEFVGVAVNNSSEVRMAALSIIDRVDLMYVATDNTVVSAITALSKVCYDNKKPLFSADTTSSFDTEVLIAGGFDYYKSGVLTGQLIERVINGESPKEIGVQYLNADSLELYLNLDIAAKLGLDFPTSLVENAKYVVKNGELLKN